MQNNNNNKKTALIRMIRVNHPTGTTDVQPSGFTSKVAASIPVSVCCALSIKLRNFNNYAKVHATTENLLHVDY